MGHVPWHEREKRQASNPGRARGGAFPAGGAGTEDHPAQLQADLCARRRDDAGRHRGSPDALGAGTRRGLEMKNPSASVRQPRRESSMKPSMHIQDGPIKRRRTPSRKPSHSIPRTLGRELAPRLSGGINTVLTCGNVRTLVGSVDGRTWPREELHCSSASSTSGWSMPSFRSVEQGLSSLLASIDSPSDLGLPESPKSPLTCNLPRFLPRQRPSAFVTATGGQL